VTTTTHTTLPPPHLHLPCVQTRAGGGFFQLSQPFCHHHHLPRIQTRVRGGFFRSFHQHLCHHLPRVQMRTGGGFFGRSNASATTTTSSLVSQRELEVVFFGCFNTSTTATTSLASKCEPGPLGCIDIGGVSFPRCQRWSGVKLTLRPVQLFSLASGTACNFVALFTTPQ